MKLNFKPLSNPLLLISDAPEQLTGLARVGRDLATLACTMPEFRVGYLGMGGYGRRKFPFAQYHFPQSTAWGSDYIQSVWHDFAGKEDGVIMSLWDASRMLWFGQPQALRADLAKFLGPGRNFAKWGYFPVDSTGPDENGLSSEPRAAVTGYDRVLAASEWGKNVLVASGRRDADWIPHGIWMDKFHPVENARQLLGWHDGQIIVGCNMANQPRKDWAVAFETAAILKAQHGNRFKFWAHTDELVRYWTFYTLAADYGVSDCTEITTELSDEQLALRYSACDCTMLPTAGEGFGFPIAESMACGVGCVVTDYAAGQELVPEELRVPPVTYKVDTLFNVRRAVLSGWGFASRVQQQIERAQEDIQGERERMVELTRHLDWNNLKHVWMRWLREGVR
jgi:glycosyltransferase involved in cell wall biosynthesis